MFTIVKILVSALVIGIITEVARRSPSVGGVIAALPLISLLSLFWLSFQGKSAEEISQFATGVLWGFPATAVLILIVALLLRSAFPLSLALLLGVGGWFLCLKVQGSVFG
ncbi:DUF3147 family protein [Shouchella shacheensis]|uniref:DUF3147 family protein n=1 Tax=Shouchella shacheensis TaxID=1649580 RepID=UPI0007403D87|nr:DUF3147 family protein [Shouchella shacheensis]